MFRKMWLLRSRKYNRKYLENYIVKICKDAGLITKILEIAILNLK